MNFGLSFIFATIASKGSAFHGPNVNFILKWRFRNFNRAPLTSLTVIAAKDPATDARKALALLNESRIRNETNKYDTCTVVNLCGRAGMWGEALQLFDETLTPDLALFHSVLGALSKSGRGIEAERILKQMTHVDSRSLEFVVTAYRNNRTGSSDTLRVYHWGCFVMSKYNMSPNLDVLINSIRACSESLDFENAFQLFHEARRRTLNSTSQNTDALEHVKTDLWKQWSRHFLLATVKRISAECSDKGSLQPIDNAATLDLFTSLGEAADEGVMPSFKNSGARSGYFVSKFVSRSSRVADSLFQLDRFLPSNLAESKLKIVSVGGGPGFDFVGASVLSEFSSLIKGQENNARGIDALVLDIEEGWRDANCVAEIVMNGPKTRHRVAFGGCDITKPIADPSNERLLKLVQELSAVPSPLPVFIASYVVAENARALRNGGFTFFSDLFSVCPEGTTFLFIETTHRIWPEILMAAYRGIDSSMNAVDIQIKFSRISGKRGFSLFIKKINSSTSSVPPRKLVDFSDGPASFEWLLERMGSINEDQTDLARIFFNDKEMHEVKCLKRRRRSPN